MGDPHPFDYLLFNFGTTRKEDLREELRIELLHAYIPGLAPIQDFNSNMTWSGLRAGPGSLEVTDMNSGEPISGTTEVYSSIAPWPQSTVTKIGFVFEADEPESNCINDCTLEIRIRGRIESKNELDPDPTPFGVDGDDWVVVLTPEAYSFQKEPCQGVRRYFIYRNPLPASLDPNR